MRWINSRRNLVSTSKGSENSSTETCRLETSLWHLSKAASIHCHSQNQTIQGEKTTLTFPGYISTLRKEEILMSSSLVEKDTEWISSIPKKVFESDYNYSHTQNVLHQFSSTVCYVGLDLVGVAAGLCAQHVAYTFVLAFKKRNASLVG